MSPNSYIILPGGWINETEGDGVLIYVLERKDATTFSFSVINTGGPGLVEYHPVNANSATDVKYKLALVVDNVPAEKVNDSAFWFLLYRMQVSL